MTHQLNLWGVSHEFKIKIQNIIVINFSFNDIKLLINFVQTYKKIIKNKIFTRDTFLLHRFKKNH